MCGIAGCLSKNFDTETLKKVSSKMAAQLAHRGPDDSGQWCDASHGIALAHQRLSIQDLSPLGHQPMQSESGRYLLIFNGEIYNFKRLKYELTKLGARFRGHSDTEVLLAAIECWGLKKALQKSIGMFAIVVWDRTTHCLHLARDRMGEKPLYYGWINSKGNGSSNSREKGSFVFASELKALTVHPDWNVTIDRDVLNLYLRHGYIPCPYSIYQNIYKLSPGTILSISHNSEKRKNIEPQRYWSIEQHFAPSCNPEQKAIGDERVDELEELLIDAIGQQMRADVPLGSFLSGGIDSSLVIALMQYQSDAPIQSYTIGFHEECYNEAHHANKVAKHIGSHHSTLYISADDALTLIPKLPSVYDEPFADQSQLPTLMLTQFMQKKVKVVLSGDGADEIFAGYRRYFVVNRIWENGFRYLPYSLRRLLSLLLNILPIGYLEKLLYQLSSSRPKIGAFNHKVVRLAEMLLQKHAVYLYRYYISYWHQMDSLVLGASEPENAFNRLGGSKPATNLIREFQYLDMLTYLPDDILVKVDRASMSVSLETRAPFLDHRVVEFASRLPSDYLVRENQGKWILRQILERHLPRQWFERPKKGFGVPMQDWLKGQLKDWAENLLDESRIREAGFFDANRVNKLWQEHQMGKGDWHGILWHILVFQAWLDENCMMKK